MSKILVTGATGTIGSILVPRLTSGGHSVRALVHNPERAPQIAGTGAEVVSADFADQLSIRAGLRGVDAVFLACGNVPQQVAYECAVIDEAARSGVGRIVKLSARGAQLGSPVAYWDWHAQIERHLEGSGIPSTVLRPGFLMTNLLASAGQVRQQGSLFAPVADARIAMIDPADVAAVAEVALTDDGHQGNTYVLTGPAAISYQQVAGELSAATGRPIGFVDIPPEAATSAMVAAGVPPFVAKQVGTVFDELRLGVQAETTGTVPLITGQPARPLAIFARNYAAAFRGIEATSAVPG
ncbi:MAG: SDR family oxidoreductase [Nakamurella sp.]